MAKTGFTSYCLTVFGFLKHPVRFASLAQPHEPALITPFKKKK
jgi:hypothetical protein